jgi:hypothetical protein
MNAQPKMTGGKVERAASMPACPTTTKTSKAPAKGKVERGNFPASTVQPPAGKTGAAEEYRARKAPARKK